MSDKPKAILDKLARVEATTGDSGAIPNTPKSMLLDASTLEKQNPNYKYRFVNIKDPNKAQRRLFEGYERVPEAEGGRSLGSEYALFRIPRTSFEARVARELARNKALLTAHRDEMEQVAESVAKVLRDQYGLDVSRNRILVEEAS